MAAITRLGAHGGPRSLYGSFAGKAEAPPEAAEAIQFGKTFYAGYDTDKATKRRLNATLQAKLRREDDEILTIINIIGKFLI